MKRSHAEREATLMVQADRMVDELWAHADTHAVQLKCTRGTIPT